LISAGGLSSLLAKEDNDKWQDDAIILAICPLLANMASTIPYGKDTRA